MLRQRAPTFLLRIPTPISALGPSDEYNEGPVWCTEVLIQMVYEYTHTYTHTYIYISIY